MGVGVSGNGADTTGRRDIPGGRASRDSDERRIKRLRQRAIDQEQEQSTSSPVHSARDVPWYAEVVATSGEKILDAATLLQSDHPFLEDDHMFSAFLARGIINDIEGYYSKSERTFTAVVALGQDVSGYAGIVHGVYLDISTSRHLDISMSMSRCRYLDRHLDRRSPLSFARSLALACAPGGLTAAIFDEVFGGLLFCLKTKHLSVDPTHYLPSFTVNLVVDYRTQIRAGSTVLCRACVDRVEGRKLYMRAELLDGPAGRVYAESTSIFVRPRMSRVAAEAGKWLAAKVKWLAVGR